MVEVITFTLSEKTQFAPRPISWGIAGIVGNANVSGVPINTVEHYTNTNSIGTRYGTARTVAGTPYQNSSLYEACLLASKNGCKQFRLVTHEQTALTPITGEVIATGTNFFDLETDWGLTAGEQLVKGSGFVKVDKGSGDIDLVEGSDYNVDYGNGVIHFDPASDVSWSWSFDFAKVTAAQINAALKKLVNVDVNIVNEAYCFKKTITEEIGTHLIEAESAKRERIGVIAGRYGDTTDIVGMTATGSNLVLVANSSGFEGAADASGNGKSSLWRQYYDVGSCINGKIAGRKPWLSLNNQMVELSNHYEEWTPTQEATLFAAKVNILTLNESDIIPSFYEAETQDGTGTFQFIDDIRTYNYIKKRFRVLLKHPSIVGTFKIKKPDLEALEGRILSELNKLFILEAIADPRLLPESHDGLIPVYIHALEIFRLPANQRSDDDKQYIQDVQKSRRLPVFIAWDYEGALHKLEIELRPA
jgi:hypothetical protein